MDITDDSHLVLFLNDRDIDKKTEKRYRIWIQNYCLSTKTENTPPLTPTELIEEAMEDEINGVHKGHRRIKKRLITFRKWLKDNNYSDRTAKNNMSTVRSFYYSFEIEVPKTIMRVKRRRESLKDLPSTDDIIKILNRSNILYRSIILMLASTGMSTVDLRNLRYGDFLDAIGNYYTPPPEEKCNIKLIEDGLNGQEVVALWRGHIRDKTEIPFLTFNTPEATRSVIEYLIKDPPQSVDDHLFRIKGVQINDYTIVNYFYKLNEKCGFNKRGRKSYITSKDFRTRFATICLDVGIHPFIAEYMIGHVLPETQGSYYKIPTDDTMREEYIKLIPHLSLIDDVEVRTVTSEQYERVSDLEAKLVERDKELEDVIRFVNVMRKQGEYRNRKSV